jgi:hypothetical protein
MLFYSIRNKVYLTNNAQKGAALTAPPSVFYECYFEWACK